MSIQTQGDFPLLKPDLQVSFYYRLQALKDLYLQDALRKTVEKLNFKKLNDQLLTYVGPDPLKRVASFGIRGEIFFPVPCILEANPFLLGYYRLLYGFSQKEFFNKGPYGRYKLLEDRGEIPSKLQSSIPSLCRSLIKSGQLRLKALTKFPCRLSTSFNS